MITVTYLSPGGKVGDMLKGTAICEKSKGIHRTRNEIVLMLR